MARLFELSSLLVMPFWLLMVFAPGWRVTRRLVASPLVAIGPALVYAALVAPRLVELAPALASPTLASVAALLGEPAGATLAWEHFLAFDLFVGRWIYLDAAERRIGALVVSPLLALTLMFGPLGLLAYLAVRAAVRPARGASDRGGGASDPEGERVGRNASGDGTVRREAERGAGPTRSGASRRSDAKRPARVFAGELRRAARRFPALAWMTAAMAALLVVCGAGLLVDSRTITGAPAWLKPAKFAISVAIYSASLLWMLGRLRAASGRARRLARAIANVSAAALAVEMAIIVLQAARGATSHFNTSTPLDQALFAAMGAFIVLVWLANLAAALLVLRERAGGPVRAAAIRGALLVTLTAVIPGALMTVPSGAQRDALARGVRTDGSGAHTVGGVDGGPGLPLVGWSAEHGDLRPAHFLALHALQVIPLAGWALAQRRRSRGAAGVLAVDALSAAFAGAVLILTWQALRGEPLVAPGAATLAAWLALGAAVAVAVAAVRSRAARASAGACPHPTGSSSPAGATAGTRAAGA